jgi:hypothetical protein
MPAERRRLNDRIHLISGSEMSRELATLRKQLCKRDAVEERGCGMVMAHSNGRRFLEPADLVAKLHAWLDARGVERNPPPRPM